MIFRKKYHLKNGRIWPKTCQNAGALQYCNCVDQVVNVIRVQFKLQLCRNDIPFSSFFLPNSGMSNNYVGCLLRWKNKAIYIRGYFVMFVDMSGIYFRCWITKLCWYVISICAVSESCDSWATLPLVWFPKVLNQQLPEKASCRQTFCPTVSISRYIYLV